jgi:hypothetical protein
LKIAFAVWAAVIGAFDMMFPGSPLSPGVLLFLALLAVFDALQDREKVKRNGDE